VELAYRFSDEGNACLFRVGTFLVALGGESIYSSFGMDFELDRIEITEAQ
jgi:hypothetical protein